MFDILLKTVFKPDDKVLVLLPIPSCLQASYCGSYLIKEKVGDRLPASHP